MLKSFAIRNFQSFHQQTQISLVLNKHAPMDDRSCLASNGSRVSKALAVIGHNASGKTTLIKSLAFLDWFIKYSFLSKIDSPLPLSSHFVSASEPAEFELEFELNAKDWRYRLVADEHRVYSEELHCRQVRSFSYVFIRIWNPSSNSYSVKQQNFGLLQKEAENVRENASLISTAAQYKIPLALEFLAANVFTNLFVHGRQRLDDSQLSVASSFYANNQPICNAMSKLLSQWDLGLSQVRIEKHTITRENGLSEEVFIPFGVHFVAEKEHALMMMQESSGTQGAYLLLSRILPALQSGGLAVIDELEADLHPHLLAPILDLFFSTHTNPKNAQLIFTCHSLEILSLLHKSQVVLVEKDKNCQSEAWRLDEVKGVRSDDNLYAKYMAGAYGAVPEL